MDNGEKNTRNAAPSSRAVVAKSANFAGSFDASARHHAAETSLPLPRERITASALLTPLTSNWTDTSIWSSTVIEAVGTLSLCYTSALLDATISNFSTPFLPAFVGVSNIFLLTLFIAACAPGSGGHLNPLISWSTMLMGLTGFSRGVLYMVGQTAGAAAAGGLVLASFGEEARTRYHGGGCFIEPGAFSVGRAFVVELVSSFMLVFLAVGVGLDPRQAKLFGPSLGPFMVGCSLALLSFASAGLAPGYTGASMNPARCFAFAVARGNFDDQWIWWFAPCAGGFLVAIIYRLVPPYHAEK